MAKQLASPGDPPDRFSDLPPELRNNIYELAYGYGHPRRMKVKPTRRMGKSQKARKCVLDHLMVSKQWFDGTKVMVADSTEFEFDSVDDFVRVVASLPEWLAKNVKSVAIHIRDDPVWMRGLGGDILQQTLGRLVKLESMRLYIVPSLAYSGKNYFGYWYVAPVTAQYLGTANLANELKTVLVTKPFSIKLECKSEFYSAIGRSSFETLQRFVNTPATAAT